VKSTDRSVVGWACETGSHNIGATALLVRSSATVRASVTSFIAYVLLAQPFSNFKFRFNSFHNSKDTNSIAQPRACFPLRYRRRFDRVKSAVSVIIEFMVIIGEALLRVQPPEQMPFHDLKV